MATTTDQVKAVLAPYLPVIQPAPDVDEATWQVWLDHFEEPQLTSCPKCGGTLREQSGKYGKFLGCSNYPSCKHTENIQ